MQAAQAARDATLKADAAARKKAQKQQDAENLAKAEGELRERARTGWAHPWDGNQGFFNQGRGAR